MKHNQQTVFFDLEEENEDFIEPVDSTESLNAAYAALGKAFYEYRFEEPTPELLLYFDQITHLLKGHKEIEQRRQNHLESMTSSPLLDSNGEEENLEPINSRSISIPPKAPRPPHRSAKFQPSGLNPTEEEKEVKIPPVQFTLVEHQEDTDFYPELENFEKPKATFSNNDNYTRKLINTHKVESNTEYQSISPNLLKSHPEEIPQSKAPKKPVCPKCGYEVAEDDIFCGNCGARLNH